VTILLAQLGDIHFEDPSDPAFTRSMAIAAAISAEVTPNVTSVVLAICGDAAYSGIEKQFTIAKKFVEDIEHEISRRHSDLKIHRTLLPGNHDCDFRGDQAARNGLLSHIKESEKPAGSIVDIVMEPLKDFFTFSSNLSGVNGITKVKPFYNCFEVEEGKLRLRIHLLNTAWMSSLHEQPGSLHFPIEEISPPTHLCDCSIAILHHPLNWFSQPQSMRPLRNRLSDLCSVILVNHEHTAEARIEVPLMKPDDIRTSTIYVSGGVIQEWGNKDICTFNLLAFDVANKQLRITRHEYQMNGVNPYFERTGDEYVDLTETAFCQGPAGASLTAKMAQFLDDPGAPISHPNRDPRIPVRLSDIFLFPDLWELDADHKGREQKQIRSSRASEEVLETPRCLITGGEKSGRTAIVKQLFTAAFKNGKVPIFLRGDEVPKKVEQLRKLLRTKVTEQYANLTPDQFEQLPRDIRVVLVDDVHRLAPASSVRRQLLEEFERQFGTVVLCGDDLIKLDEMSGRNPKDSGLWEYRHLMILGFGEYLREEFVRQWIMLGGDTVPDDDILEKEVERICSLLNVVIKKQLLPAYPLFLLVILQQSDLATASVQSGSFGKLFEGLITAILNKTKFSRISIGDKYYYLAALAKRMYDNQAMCLSLTDAQKWHREYWDEIEVEISFERLTDDLQYLGLLSVNDTDVKFKYVYFFCFFVAYRLNRTLHEESTKTLIRQLSQQLHHRVSSDIVLFLAHLTGDPIVLNEMVRTCDLLFQDVTPANLDSDVEPLNRLANIIETISIPDKPDQNRRELKIRQDAVVVERLAETTSNLAVVAPEADNESIKRLFDINAAYRTIQILGQALRNIAGSASKSRKEEVIAKIVGLSRRVMGVYFELFEESVIQHVIEEMALAHQEQQPELVASDLHGEVCRHLTGLSQFVCFSLIKHTTFSVGSENLSPTIHRVLSQDTASIVKLFDLSFDLERPGRFPKDDAIRLYREQNRNLFAASLVRILVAHHMYLYVVPIQDRQAVCEKMDIKLLNTVMDRSRKRLT
jgi:hypothetical protein